MADTHPWLTGTSPVTSSPWRPANSSGTLRMLSRSLQKSGRMPTSKMGRRLAWLSVLAVTVWAFAGTAALASHLPGQDPSDVHQVARGTAEVDSNATRDADYEQVGIL